MSGGNVQEGILILVFLQWPVYTVLILNLVQILFYSLLVLADLFSLFIVNYTLTDPSLQ